MGIYARRRVTNWLVITLSVLATGFGLLWLVLVLSTLLVNGVVAITPALFTEMTPPPGSSGGLLNAIAGSLAMTAIATLVGTPTGILAGTFLAEYARGRFGDIIRFTADILNGVPSIVIGIVAYGIVVLRQRHFSALAGGVALAIMMVPTITRATEEMLLLVPTTVREAAYGLGVSRWRTTLSITLRTATSGVITGVMLAFARIAGETAPLLFTAFGNTYWNWNVNQPTAALPLQIFVYAISPFDEWHRQAWAGALVLIVLIVISVSAVRIAAGRGMLKGTS